MIIVKIEYCRTDKSHISHIGDSFNWSLYFCIIIICYLCIFIVNKFTTFKCLLLYNTFIKRVWLFRKMYDVFALNIFTHEDSLFLNKSVWVSKVNKISRIDFVNILWSFQMIFVKDLVLDSIKIDKKNNNLLWQLSKHCI